MHARVCKNETLDHRWERKTDLAATSSSLFFCQNSLVAYSLALSVRRGRSSTLKPYFNKELGLTLPDVCGRDNVVYFT